MLPHSKLWDCLTQTKLEITTLQHADLSTRKHSKNKLIARPWENARKDWKLQLLGNTGADVSAHQACFQTTLSGKHNPWLQRTSSRAQNVWDNEGKPNNILSLLWSYLCQLSRHNMVMYPKGALDTSPCCKCL
jgi:hypothetical protein